MRNINDYNERMVASNMLPPSARVKRPGWFFGFRVIQLTHINKVLKSFILDPQSGDLREHLLEEEGELLRKMESSQSTSEHAPECHHFEEQDKDACSVSEKPSLNIKPSCIRLLGDQLECHIARSNSDWQTTSQSSYLSLLNPQSKAFLRQQMLDLCSEIEKESQSV
jgi:hypothetical protein